MYRIVAAAAGMLLVVAIGVSTGANQPDDAPTPNQIAPTGAASDVVTEHVIEIAAFKFIPEELTVRPGDRIRWINRDLAPHTATARDRSWDSGRLARNGEWTMTAEGSGRVEYYCVHHPAMTARLIIETDARD